MAIKWLEDYITLLRPFRLLCIAAYRKSSQCIDLAVFTIDLLRRLRNDNV